MSNDKLTYQDGYNAGKAAFRKARSQSEHMPPKLPVSEPENVSIMVAEGYLDGWYDAWAEINH